MRLAATPRSRRGWRRPSPHGRRPSTPLAFWRYVALSIGAATVAAADRLGLVVAALGPVADFFALGAFLTLGLYAASAWALFNGGDPRDWEHFESMSTRDLRIWGLASTLFGAALPVSPWISGTILFALELYREGGTINPTLLMLMAVAATCASFGWMYVGLRVLARPEWIGRMR